MAVSYEWDIETVDRESGDVLDHFHCTTLAEAHKPEPNEDLVLVRDIGNDLDGLTDRSWAYVEDGVLPEYFTNASGCETARVPKRFHKELTEWEPRT